MSFVNCQDLFIVGECTSVIHQNAKKKERKKQTVFFQLVYMNSIIWDWRFGYDKFTMRVSFHWGKYVHLDNKVIISRMASSPLPNTVVGNFLSLKSSKPKQDSFSSINGGVKWSFNFAKWDIMHPPWMRCFKYQQLVNEESISHFNGLGVTSVTQPLPWWYWWYMGGHFLMSIKVH